MPPSPSRRTRLYRPAMVLPIIRWSVPACAGLRAIPIDSRLPATSSAMLCFGFRTPRTRVCPGGAFAPGRLLGDLEQRSQARLVDHLGALFLRRFQLVLSDLVAGH